MYHTSSLLFFFVKGSIEDQSVLLLCPLFRFLRIGARNAPALSAQCRPLANWVVRMVSQVPNCTTNGKCFSWRELFSILPFFKLYTRSQNGRLFSILRPFRGFFREVIREYLFFRLTPRVGWRGSMGGGISTI